MKRESSPHRLLKTIWEVTADKYKMRGDLNGEVSIYDLHAYCHYDQLRFVTKDLARLASSKYILYLNDERSRFRLTRSGMNRLVRICIAGTSQYQNELSRQCIVSFDIPEIHESRRNLLRRILKESGLSRLHRSTWVGDPSIALHIQYVIAMEGLDRWTRVFIGEELNVAKTS